MKRRGYLSGGLGLVATLSGCLMVDGNSTSRDLVATETRISESSRSTAACSTATPNQISSQTLATNQPTETPTTVVRSYYEAVYDGDADTANALLHRHSPISEHTPAEISALENFQYRLTNIQENQTHPNQATVSFTVTLVSPDGDTRRNKTAIEVRHSCTKWKIWK
ncbi:uncharacterized protein HHUB_4322 (plasmid) [Halobacterium hubeiense]|uniref:Uncharacterized protein n=1 Tax=Halobacterium hubeiense TaxID=1407499 RepID=A0A0U5H525_9EURY|nr:uncharacterized protein HHUB_4322 [Halobacterium hubeiense]